MHYYIMIIIVRFIIYNDFQRAEAFYVRLCNSDMRSDDCRGEYTHYTVAYYTLL